MHIKFQNLFPISYPSYFKSFFEVKNGKKFNTTKVQIEAPHAIWAPYLDKFPTWTLWANALYSKSSLINVDICFYSQIESKDHIEIVKM